MQITMGISVCLLVFSLTCVTPFSVSPRRDRTAIPITIPFLTTAQPVAGQLSAASVSLQEGEEAIRESLAEGRLVKLNSALVSFNSTDAQHLLQEFQNIRESSTEPGAVEKVLDGILHEVEDRKLPLWTKWKFLARYSERARLASLLRTLRLTTPPPSQDEQDSDESAQRRRRRALLGLIRTLQQPAADNGFPERTTPAIRQIERRAVQEQNRSKRSVSTSELIQRRPEGLETPKYEVLVERSDYEIRSYRPFAVCSVSMGLDREADPKMDAAVNEPAKGNVKAFGALAGYLFGKNQQQTAMKMTTPVLTTEDRRMSFVLPSDYWNEANPADAAPQPLDGSGVKVERVPSGKRAVVLFGGYAVGVDKKKEELLQHIAKDSDWEVIPGETPVLAAYNDPFTPPWKRLNEVSIAVQASSHNN